MLPGEFGEGEEYSANEEDSLRSGILLFFFSLKAFQCCGKE
jgi:hypothetical protein